MTRPVPPPVPSDGYRPTPRRPSGRNRQPRCPRRITHWRLGDHLRPIWSYPERNPRGWPCFNRCERGSDCCAKHRRGEFVDATVDK